MAKSQRASVGGKAAGKPAAETECHHVENTLKIVGPWNTTIWETTHELSCLHYSELFDYILIGCTDGVLRVFKDGKFVMHFIDDDIKNNPSVLTGLTHRPVSKNYPICNALLATYGNGFIKCWNYNFQTCTWTVHEDREITGIKYHPKLAKFLTLGDKKILMYDEDSRRQERVLSASDDKNSHDGHQGVITAACFNPKQNNVVISGGLDNTIQFWDLRQPNAVRNIQGVTMKGSGLAFTHTGTEFVTCSINKDKPLRLWDFGSATEIKVIEPDNYHSLLSSGEFMTKNSLICAGAEPNIVRIVNMDTSKSIFTAADFPKPVTSITIGPTDGNNLTKFACCAGNRFYEFSPK